MHQAQEMADGAQPLVGRLSHQMQDIGAVVDHQAQDMVVGAKPLVNQITSQAQEMGHSSCPHHQELLLIAENVHM